MKDNSPGDGRIHVYRTLWLALASCDGAETWSQPEVPLVESFLIAGQAPNRIS